jgi:hypothetical protein
MQDLPLRDSAIEYYDPLSKQSLHVIL